MPALKLKDKDGNWIPLPTIKGADGKSAYQQAVEAGYTGTEAEFYAALVSLKDGPFLPTKGGTMTGPLKMGSNDLCFGAYKINDIDGGIGIYADSVYLYGSGGRQASLGGIGAPYYDTDAANKEYVDSKVAKSAAVTLTAAGWSGSGPYTQMVSVAGLLADQKGDIGLAQSATAEQRSAAREAMISVTGQAAGSLTVTADGERPTVDIPCVVVMLG